MPIVGVVQDFHIRSFRETIKPLAIASRASEHLTFNISLSGGSSTWPSAISKIQKAFKEVYPEDNWHYSFIDETIANYYKAEQYTSTLLKWATFLSIFISCLGLAGVALYIMNQRQKEIGVRKVLGVTVTQLLVLLSTDFLLFIGIAFMITVPAAWWWAHSWLQDFAYKTTLSWEIFIMAGVFMGAVALLTISLQTIRAALANPVKSLAVE